MDAAGVAVMKLFLRLFPQYRQMEADLQACRESDRKLMAEVIRLGNVAYDRRVALRDILTCQTPGSNATVRRMAGIAAKCLQNTGAFSDVKVERDRVSMILTGGGGGGGGGPGVVSKVPQ
jgi:hypothetical protein